jgi:hypothetical protein
MGEMHFATAPSELAVQRSAQTTANAPSVPSMLPPRQLTMNGKVVGEVPAAETIEEQADAAFALLAKIPSYRAPSSSEVMFRQALAFARTSSMLYNTGLKSPPRDFSCVAPFVVNTALAIELYLKAIAHIHGARLKDLKGHDLLDLFARLPEPAKSRASKHISHVTQSGHIKSMEDLQRTLQLARTAFVDWRYVYEDEFCGEIEIQPMISAVEILDTTCRAALEEAKRCGLGKAT